MASSLLLSTTFTTSSYTPISTFTTSSSSFKARTKQAHGLRVSCKASPEDNINENQLILPETQKLVLPNNVDRRNLLVGLGGLYTAANIGSLPSALADPITTPDIISSCQESTSGFEQKGALRTGKCCPPNLEKTIQLFEFPSKLEKTRKRWPAHKGSKKQVDSYKKAIQAIRHLPDDHPHSFVSQAKIHCAYCNGGYTETGFPDKEIEVHNSWLFFPFHRWYLYFYERILRKYSGDDDFALPYWNWDNPEGMKIPQIFLEDGKQNPLYDEYRNPDHLPKVVNLTFSTDDYLLDDPAKQIACNLGVVYRDLTSNATNSEAFFGGKYTAYPGDPNNPDKRSAGSVETSHNAVHVWVGQAKNPTSSPNGEDMGNFYSAAYDPLFYVHHTNVDRMWKLWKDLGTAGHSEPTDDDWLNASYVFYDENENLVRVYNKDSVNIDKLKFDYEESKTLWKNSRPAQQVKIVENAFKPPARVDPLLKVHVKRPATNRTPEQKKKAKEILFINGIQFNSNKFVKFEVFVNDKVDIGGKLPTACDPEFAGSFAQVPHGGNKVGMLMPSAARFGLDELLEDTKTEGDEYALVALVARAGCDDLTVSGIEIKLEPILY
ncbi:putative domain, di-copper centre, Polyphenol oxidase [Artemisia annua]|uniref:Putative domain, di-copper centre, Polyphenol oxidase n=1 Tax=Artemisia annua TaxID=35608 RepID=A0A2U1KUF4_ARTAN|nr:putative domain, di-copper centre, Polyphenol oxidase [Artemisia annua]